MIEETLCPVCGGPMKSRLNGKTGQRFWGCAAYPKCKGTRNTDGDAPRAHGRDEADTSLPEDRLPSQRWQDRDRGRW